MCLVEERVQTIINGFRFCLLSVLVPDTDVAITQTITVTRGDVPALEYVGTDLDNVAHTLWRLLSPSRLLQEIDLAILFDIVDAQFELDHAGL